MVIVDNFVYLAYFPLILVCKRWAKPFNRWTGVSQAQLDHFTEETQKVERKTHEVHFRDILTLLGWAFVAILAANWLSTLVPPLPPVLTQRTWATAPRHDVRYRPVCYTSQERCRERSPSPWPSSIST